MSTENKPTTFAIGGGALTTAVPAIGRNLMCVLIEPPKIFDQMEDPEAWKQALRDVLQLLPTSITGFPLTLTLANNRLGSYTVNHAEPNLQMDWQERYGEPITAFFTGYMEHIQHHSKIADDEQDRKLAADMPATARRIMEAVSRECGFKAVFFTPDQSMTHVLRAWYVEECMPELFTASDSYANKKDLQDAILLQASFQGKWKYGKVAHQIATKALNALLLTSANSHLPSTALDTDGPTGAPL